MASLLMLLLGCGASAGGPSLTSVRQLLHIYAAASGGPSTADPVRRTAAVDALERLFAVCPKSDFGGVLGGLRRQCTRPVAPAGALADSVHAAYLGRQRALKAALADTGLVVKKGGWLMTQPWVHMLAVRLLQMTPQSELGAPGKMGHSAIQLAAAYADHNLLTRLLHRGARPYTVVHSSQYTAAELAERNCDNFAILLLNSSRSMSASLPRQDRLQCFITRTAVWNRTTPSVEYANSADVLAAQQVAWTNYMRSGWAEIAVIGHRPNTIQWNPEQSDPPGLPRCSTVLPTISSDRLTKSHFQQILAAADSPMLIVNGTSSWGLQEAMMWPALRRHYGNIDLAVSEIPYGEIYSKRAGVASIDEMLDYIKGQSTLSDRQAINGSVLYGFDAEALQRTFMGMYSLPDSMNQILADWPMQVHQFALGPAFAGAPWHFHEDAVNVLVYGRKLWDLLPPANAVFSTVAPAAEFVQGPDDLLLPREVGNGTRCVQLPGDMLYIPRRWAHRTFNLVPGVGIAIESDGSACTLGSCRVLVI